jgi:hypothetical protein
VQSGGFTGSVILGAGATANAGGQLVLGSTTFPLGPVVASASLTNNQAMCVNINGQMYKILLYQD